MAKNEADWIAVLLSSNYRFYDLLNVELGNWQILDNWVLREEAFVRAFPCGLALHVLPGNVPLSAVLSEAVVGPEPMDSWGMLQATEAGRQASSKPRRGGRKLTGAPAPRARRARRRARPLAVPAR